MAENNITEQLQRQFKGRKFFSRKELYALFRQLKPEMKDATLRWIIYNLKKKGLITSISKEYFTLSFKSAYKPKIDKTTKKIYVSVEKQFTSLKFCIWSTQILSEFMIHIPVKHFTVLQVEKEALEPVYEFLKGEKIGDIFIQPEEKEIDRYLNESNKAILLLPLVTKSPIQKINNTVTITLEKLIVDVYADKKIFAAFQGGELVHIINNAYNRYAIDFTKLFYYAKRRRKDIELRELFSQKTDIPNDILND